MRKSDITDEVKRLSKEIAEYWRMEIYEGCWIRVGNKTRLILNIVEEYFFTNDYYPGGNPQFKKKSGFPIPSISDCERKLVEMGYESMNLQRRPFKNPWMADIWDKESHDLEANTIKRWEDKGKTLHEICLSVLLKVLTWEEK